MEFSAGKERMRWSRGAEGMLLVTGSPAQLLAIIKLKVPVVGLSRKGAFLVET